MKSRILLIASLVVLFAASSAFAQRGDHPDRPNKPAANNSVAAENAKDAANNKVLYWHGGAENDVTHSDSMTAIPNDLNAQGHPPAEKQSPGKNDSNPGKSEGSNSGNARPERGDKIR